MPDAPSCPPCDPLAPGTSGASRTPENTAEPTALTNRLGDETSPYLLQHKDNPVAWQPWGEEAFRAARESNRPILLSVGYAACHWCHVMAHESFENGRMAELMNRLFVNVKVDREERPDVDAIYQSAIQLLGEQGGWPLTVFLTPQGDPFWGGTYFPPEPRYGRPGFPQILNAIAQTYSEAPDKVSQNITALRKALEDNARSPDALELPADLHLQLGSRLQGAFDPQNGGFGGAPKFPQPGLLKFFWRLWQESGEGAYRDAAELTLLRMCQGGIYDHLGGGFARYAVDERWLVPHFEKMLYDNAQLLEILTWAWQDSGNPLYAARMEETVAWLFREMMTGDPADSLTGPAFASSLDADSEGEEGKFYVWQEDQVDALLGADAGFFKSRYDVGGRGNWEGKTILNRLDQDGLGPEAEEARLREARSRLFAAREARIPPGRDDKVLADWNGLMIASLARAGAALGREDWIGAAKAAFAFIEDNLKAGSAPDGTADAAALYHSWRAGKAHNLGMLEDYANMAEAALALQETTQEPAYLAAALSYADFAGRHFWDEEAGGYFLTAAGAKDLILRPKSAVDNATPSGNTTLLGVHARLYHLTGKEDQRARAEAILKAFSGEAARNAFALFGLLSNRQILTHAVQIVIVGPRGDARRQALIDAQARLCLPNRVLQVMEPDGALPDGHPAQGKTMLKDGDASPAPCAYVCRGMTCSLPITSAEELETALRS